MPNSNPPHRPNNPPYPPRPPIKPPFKPWGISTSEFYESLHDKPVVIVTTDGKIFKGVLAGIDQFDLILKINGTLVLLTKHAVKMVSADTTPPGTV